MFLKLLPNVTRLVKSYLNISPVFIKIFTKDKGNLQRKLHNKVLNAISLGLETNVFLDLKPI